jgi:hypothetical protein
VDEVEFAVDGTIVSKLKLFYMLLSTWRKKKTGGSRNARHLGKYEKVGWLGQTTWPLSPLTSSTD